MTQRQKRSVALIGVFAASGFFLWLGDDWTISSVPAQYVGYIVMAVGIAGLLGINIWYGGPLDPRKDKSRDSDAPPTSSNIN